MKTCNHRLQPLTHWLSHNKALFLIGILCAAQNFVLAESMRQPAAALFQALGVLVVLTLLVKMWQGGVR